MKITFVKKVLANGEPCKKCVEVMEKMVAANQMQFIDKIAIADQTDKNSEGMQLAIKYEVDRAPFFLVEHDNGSVEVFTIYYKLVKEVFNFYRQSA